MSKRHLLDKHTTHTHTHKGNGAEMRRCDALNSHRVGSNFSLPFLDTCFELALAKLPATLSNNPWATQEAGSVIWVTAEDREAL